MWLNENGKLTKTYNFADFVSAFGFVAKISILAEKLGHHPEITFTWGKVVISTTTHDKGNTITEKDIELTKQIDQL